MATLKNMIKHITKTLPRLYQLIHSCLKVLTFKPPFEELTSYRHVHSSWIIQFETVIFMSAKISLPTLTELSNRTSLPSLIVLVLY